MILTLSLISIKAEKNRVSQSDDLSLTKNSSDFMRDSNSTRLVCLRNVLTWIFENSVLLK